VIHNGVLCHLFRSLHDVSSLVKWLQSVHNMTGSLAPVWCCAGMVHAMALSVCSSVCLSQSVTSRFSVKTIKHMIITQTIPDASRETTVFLYKTFMKFQWGYTSGCPIHVV